MRCSIRAVGVFAAAAAMLIGSLSTAQAETPTSSGSADQPSDTVAAITQAVAEARQAPGADNPHADLPAHGSDTVELTGDTIATAAPPWAIDADGQAVPTSLRDRRHHPHPSRRTPRRRRARRRRSRRQAG